MRRMYIVFVFTLLLTSSLQGVSMDTGDDEKKITYAMAFELSDFTFYTEDYSNRIWQSAIQASLYKRDTGNTHEWVPDLAATSATTTDGKVWTVDLRPDAKFSDGTPVTSDDIIFSLKVVMTPEIYSTADFHFVDYRKYMDNNSVVKIDQDTVEIHFLNTPSFPLSVMSFPVVEKSLYESEYTSCIQGNPQDCDWSTEDGSHLVSAGPYMVDYINVTANEVSLVKNPYYYGDVDVDRLVFRTYYRYSNIIDDYIDGKIDIIDVSFSYVIGDNLDNITESQWFTDPAHYEITLNHLNPYYGTGLGTPKGKDNATFAPLAALYVRRAMSFITNREFYANEILDGYAIPAASTIPPCVPGADPTFPPDPYNVTEARMLMEMAGYDFSTLDDLDGDGSYETFFFNLTIMAPVSHTAQGQIPPVWEKDLAKIGIGVTDLYVVGWDVIVPRTFGYKNETANGTYTVPLYDNGGYDTLFVGYGWTFDWDPSGLYKEEDFLPDGGNFMNFRNVTVSTLIDRYLGAAMNRTEQLELVKELQKAIRDSLPVIPLIHPRVRQIYRPEIDGIDALMMVIGSFDWSKISRISEQQTDTDTSSTPANSTESSSTSTTNTSSSAETRPTSDTTRLSFYGNLVVFSIVVVTVMDTKRRRRSQ